MECIQKLPKKSGVPLKNYQKTGKFPVIDQGQDFIGGYTDNESLVYSNDLPVVIFGDHTRAIKFIDFPFAVGADGTKVLKPKDFLNSKFFYFALMSLDVESRGYARHFRILKEKKIPLPPIAKQKKIVARLEGLLGKVKEAKRLRAEAQEAAQSLLPAELHRIFTQPTTPHKQHPYKLEYVRMSDKPTFVKTPAAKWEEKELGEIALLVRGPFGGSLKKDIFVEAGDCVYEQGNVIDRDLKNFRYFIIPEKFDQMKRFAVSAGDILMSCSGTIGKFVIVPEKFKKGIINQALLKITPIQKITSEFLRLTLENYFSSNNTHVKGMAIKNIAAVKELKKIKIPLPSVAEQKKIVARLDSLSEKIRRLQEYQKSTASDFISLEQSILSKSFQ